ncbi:FHA domain-containing protein [Nocardioides litoris]|uniref:FHA domain-containing protein n=1 Tax=Nocardioides litoris TaxID=1926648 RepID=UPI0011231CE9|nr:FHA domain-containing protein [Nocardioides litoris]
MTEQATADPTRSYRPGTWFGVFGAATTLLLPDSEKARVGELWAHVDDGAGFDEVLDALLRSGLATLPGFVLVGSGEGPTRLLLRGASVRATVVTADETVELDGSAASTWVERTLDGVTALTVQVDGGGAEADGSDAGDLPIHGGLVRVGRIDQPAATAAAPAPAGAPVIGGAAGETGAADEQSTDQPDDLPADEPLGAPAGSRPAGSAPVVPDVPDHDPASGVPAGEAPLPPAPLAPPVGPPPVGPPPPTDPPSWSPDKTDAPVVDADPEPAPVDPPAAFDPAPVDVPPGEPEPSPAETETELLEISDEQDVADQRPDPLSDPLSAPLDAPYAASTPPPPPADPFPSAEAAPPPPPPFPAAPEGSSPFYAPTDDSDHDGLTQAGVDADEFSRPQTGLPGQPLPPDVGPSVARLAISHGETVEVDRVVLVGRAPEARRFTTTDQPRLVTVPSPLHEISSTHIEVRPGSGPDHGSAVVTDMGSTNGTILVQPGLSPEELKPGIAVQLIPGATINLGDGVTIQVLNP